MNLSYYNNKKKYYNIFLICTSIGALGEYTSLVALNWFIIENFNSINILGTIFFFRIVPRFFMGYLGGYLADKYNRRCLIIIIYGGVLITSFFQAFIIFFSNNLHWQVIAGTIFFRGFFDGAEPSIRNAILPDLVKSKNISKAIGYYSSGLNTAAIIAPLIAVSLASVMNIKFVFWFDLALQVPTFLILFFMPKLPNHIIKGASTSFKTAFLYIKNSSLLLNCILLSSLLMFIIFPFASLLSVYVKKGLALEMNVYGWISGVESIGAVLGGFIIGKITYKQQKKIWPFIGVIACIFLIGLGFTTKLWAIYPIIFCLGFSIQLFRSISRMLFHMNTPEQMRGKVMSIAISDSGFVSLGLLVSTAMASQFNIHFTFALMGIIGSIATLLFYFFFYRKGSTTK